MAKLNKIKYSPNFTKTLPNFGTLHIHIGLISRKVTNVKPLKIIFILTLALGIWYFTENFPSGYYLDQNGLVYKLYISFFNDLTQPFALYFVLCLFEKWIPRLKPWQAKALLVFLLPASIEIGQFIYQKLELIRLFSMYGGGFDPLDFLAYAAGGLLAAFVERKIFAKSFKWWNESSAPAKAY